eukprot:COSAG01_NODE_23096_length_828_cov_1.462277_1_plen_156_part_10
MPRLIAVDDDPLLGRDELGPTTSGAHQGCCRKRQLLLAIIGTVLAVGALTGVLVGVITANNNACPTASDAGCGPHGRCELINGKPACFCAGGWAGDDCTRGTGCDDEPCKNGATCTASGGNHSCACAVFEDGPPYGTAGQFDSYVLARFWNATLPW